MAMKVSSNVFALLLSASLACAQTGTAEQPAKPAGQPKAASSSVKKPPAKSSPAAANTGAKSGKTSAAAKSTVPAGKPAAASSPARAKSAHSVAAPATSAHSTQPAAPKAAPPAHPAATPFARKPAPASAPAPKPELKPAAQESKPAATVPTAPVAAAAPPASVQMAKPYSSTGKRDPFLSPIQVASTGSGGCSGGKRCLMINQITLRGIVKSVNGWIAVVENSAQKTYFLRENDPVLNGFVSRITGETVVFKESVVDTLGHQSQRDITKHVSAPVV